MNDKNSLDDLIGNQQPIIVQEGGSDKKLLYILLVRWLRVFCCFKQYTSSHYTAPTWAFTDVAKGQIVILKSRGVFT